MKVDGDEEEEDEKQELQKRVPGWKAESGTLSG